MENREFNFVEESVKIPMGRTVEAVNKRYCLASKRLYEELKDGRKYIEAGKFCREQHIDNLFFTVLKNEGILLVVGSKGRKPLYQWGGREPNYKFADILRRKIYEHKFQRGKMPKKEIRNRSILDGNISLINVGSDTEKSIEKIGSMVIQNKPSKRYKLKPEKEVVSNDDKRQKGVEVNLLWGLFRYKSVK